MIKNTISFPLRALIFLLVVQTAHCQTGVGINTTGAAADASAMLDVSSTSSGMLVPRMSTAQRNAIASPVVSLLIFNTDINNFEYYSGSGWSLVSGPNGIYTGNGTIPSATAVSVTDNVNFDGNTFYIDGTNNRVGINTNVPGQALDISGNSRTSGEMISTMQSGFGQFRAISGNYGFFLRNDGGSTYFMFTAAGDQYGAWNSLRPMVFDNASGNVSIGNSALNVQHGGNVGIGTNSPANKLHVVGSSGNTLRVEDGNQAAGKILTSDANGNATWQNAPPGADGDGIYSGSGTTPANTSVSVSNYLNFDANTLYLDGTNNRVGIGTNAPSDKLVVAGGRSILNSQANSGASPRNFGPMLWADNNFGMELGNNGNWTTRVFTRETDGNIELGKYIGSATNVNDFSAWMTIANNGRVGIGLSSPGNKFHTYDAGTGDWLTRYENGAANVYLASNLGYGMHINTGGANSSSRYALEVKNASQTHLYVRDDGNIGLGTVNPTSMLHLANGGEMRIYGPANTAYASLRHSGATGGNLHLDAVNGGGSYINWFGGSAVHVGNGAGGYGSINASAFTVASSERFKEDIVDSEYGLAHVMELNAKEYKYINDASQRNEIGLIAEEVELVVPEVVYKNEEGLTSGIDYSKLTPILIEAMKEQQELIEELKKRIEELEKK